MLPTWISAMPSLSAAQVGEVECPVIGVSPCPERTPTLLRTVGCVSPDNGAFTVTAPCPGPHAAG